MWNRPTVRAAPSGSGATRIRSPFTTTPRPDRSTTHRPVGVSTRPQWYGDTSSATRLSLHASDLPTSVITRLTTHLSFGGRPFLNSSCTAGRVAASSGSVWTGDASDRPGFGDTGLRRVTRNGPTFTVVSGSIHAGP